MEPSKKEKKNISKKRKRENKDKMDMDDNEIKNNEEEEYESVSSSSENEIYEEVEESFEEEEKNNNNNITSSANNNNNILVNIWDEKNKNNLKINEELDFDNNAYEMLHRSVCAAALHQGFYSRKFLILDDRLVVVFDYNVLAFIQLYVFAVDLFPCVFAGAHGANVKIVFQNALDRCRGPCGFYLTAIVHAFRFLALPLRHARRGDPFIGQVVRDLLVSPTVCIQLKNLAHKKNQKSI